MEGRFRSKKGKGGGIEQGKGVGGRGISTRKLERINHRNQLTQDRETSI